MIIIKDFAQRVGEESVAALGNFDGMHIAHQEIIKNCVVYAKHHKLKSSVVTFHPSPKAVMGGDSSYKPLITLEQKLNYFECYGVDIVHLIHFDKAFASISAERFASEVLIAQIKARHVITGYNFLFGSGRKGNAHILAKLGKELGFSYQVIDQITYNYHEVSSSNIKKLMLLGACGIVNSILGRKYSISGAVAQGHKKARELGFPTANILLDQTMALPLYGVYLVQLTLEGGLRYGIANIGIRPTFLGIDPLLEVHIFDFNENIYDKTLEVNFLHFIRPERKFKGVEQLKSQILSDIEGAKYALKNLFINSLCH